MERHDPSYGFGLTLDLPFGEAQSRVRGALAAEGFGVLCEIDVAATLHAKLGVDVGPYLILGVCNPPLAYQALSADRDVGLLLPCNVVLYDAGQAEHTVVAVLDPQAALALSRNEALVPLAREAKERLQRALHALEEHRVPTEAPPSPAGSPGEIVEEIC